MRLALILSLLLASAAWAADIYVAPAATGDASGSDAGNCMAILDFIDDAAPGDNALCQPGDYTVVGGGLIQIRPEYGSSVGTSAAKITIKADPATCTPRSSDWFTRDTYLESPNPAIHPVFGEIRIEWNRSAPADPNSWYAAGNDWLVLDGLWATRIAMHYCVGQVEIKNCNVFPPMGDYSSIEGDFGIEFRHYASHGSDFHDITITDCYIRRGTDCIYLRPYCSGPIRITGCRMHDTSGSGFNCHPLWHQRGSHRQSPPDSNMVVTLADSHIGGYYPIVDDGGTAVIRAITSVTTQQRVFVTADPDPTYYQFIRVHDVSADVWSDRQFLTATRYNSATNTVTLDSDVGFEIEAGVDEVRFYDAIHGNGVHIGSDKLTMRRNWIHTVGASALLYIYKNDANAVGVEDLTLDDNLIWGSYNTSYTVQFDSPYNDVGDRFRMVGNTILGMTNTILYDTYHYYGNGVNIRAAAGTDKSTWVICNNLLPSLLVGSIVGGVTNNNIVYAHTSAASGDYNTIKLTELGTDGSDPNNANNVIIYAGEAAGSEPEAFMKGGGYFVSSAADFNDVYSDRLYATDLFADLHILPSSPARDAGDAGHKTTTDIDGDNRADPLPDVGCDEFPTVLKWLLGVK